MNYDPQDIPLMWTADGRIIIAHTELYSWADVFSPSCAGSGFYEISAAGSVRPIAVGSGFCQAIMTYGLSLHPAGRAAIYSERAKVNRSRLARIDLASGKVDTLTTGCRIYQESPAISPDGEWVAARGLCTGRDQEHYLVYVARLDGSGYRFLPAPAPGSYGEPAWSPDGRELAVVRSYGGLGAMDTSEVWAMDITGEHARLLGRGNSPAWSPRGDWIAFVANERRREESSIRIVAPSGADGREVFRNGERGTYSRGFGASREGASSGPLVWSPDGGQLLFPRRYDNGTSIWKLDIGTGSLSRVTGAGH